MLYVENTIKGHIYWLLRDLFTVGVGFAIEWMVWG
jgi:hypothetical protein